MAAALLLAGCGEKKVRMTTAPQVPAATGTAELSRDSNGNTVVDLKVKHLAPPDKLTPPKTGYVVWIQSRGGAPENKGQLRVNENLEGEFKSPAPQKTFDIFVTAEDNPRADTPQGPEVLRQSVSE
jgi:hypothetical protein